jgi:hypothetical protein
VSVKPPKRPRDPFQLAKQVGDIATGQTPSAPDIGPQEDSPAISRGRKGGLKGGNARAASLSRQERSRIARKAAEARWRKP